MYLNVNAEAGRGKREPVTPTYTDPAITRPRIQTSDLHVGQREFQTSNSNHGPDRLHNEPDSVTDSSVSQQNITSTAALVGQRHDPEKGLPKNEEGNGTQYPHLVTWSGPGDVDNPKNWPIKSKWVATLVVSIFTFISPVSSSMVAPALAAVSKDLNITNQVETELVLSIFVLAYAIGPLVFGPLSENFGRVRVILWSNLFYLAWNLGCGFAQSEAEILVFRFLSGIGGSAPLAIGGGVLSDCWHPEQRGKAVGIYSLAPLLGPVVGPIAGGFIAGNTTWRWVFWATSAVAGLVQVLGFFFLPETHHPTLLRRKKDRLKKETGNDRLYTEQDHGKDLLPTLGGALARPARMLATQPIVQLIALYMAYLFGLFYLLLSSFPAVWEDVYHESVGIGGLNYISLGVGYVIGAQVNARVNDSIYIRLKRKHDDVGRPEFRIPPMFVGSVLVPAGLFWYGWSVQARLHWMMPNVGIAIFSAGSIACLQSMQSYIIDSYSRFAASGLAAAVVLRSLAGFGFPLFAPYMYLALDQGWGNSVLGFISIAIGIPSPYIFWAYGVKLRAKSKYAAG
ncbi:synaptic vesicle transporter [Whalleya microplaca]|nr:synaptic vesicle transporter [Whalleya microplaca]